MKWEQILNAFESLAKSQGFYGRVLDTINNLSEESLESVINELESQNFKDVVDLVMFMEGC